MPNVLSDEEIGLTPLSDEDIGLKQLAADELKRKTLEARIEGQQAKAIQTLADVGAGASYWIADALAKVDPTGIANQMLARQGVPRTPPILKPEDVDTAIEVVKKGLHIPETAPAEGKLGQVTRGLSEAGKEMVVGMSDPGMLAGLGLAKAAPQEGARLFQYQMMGALPSTTEQALQAQNLEEAVKGGVGVAANVGFPIALNPTAAGPRIRIPEDFKVEPIQLRPEAAPIERATPEQAAAQAEQMAARFEEKPATEPSIISPEKPENIIDALQDSIATKLTGLKADIENLKSAQKDLRGKEVAPVEKPVEEPAKPAMETKAVEPLSDEQIGLTEFDLKPLTESEKTFAEALAKKYGTPVAPINPAIDPLEQIYRFRDMLERAADASKDPKELSQILSAAKGKPMEGRVANAIIYNPHSSFETFELAKSNPEWRGGILEENIPHYDQRRAELRKQRGLTAEPESPKPAEAPVEAVAKVETKVQDVAQSEGARPAKEIKSELLDRLQKAIEEAPTKEEVAQYEKPQRRRYKETITIEIPDDGTFVVPNTKENISEVFARAKRISTSSNVANAPRIYRASQDIARQAEAASQAYGSVENAYRSVKRQKDSLQAQETPRTEEERNQWNKQIDDAEYLMRELYGNTKAGKLEQQAETARDRAATYRMGAEGFGKEIKRIESLKKQTAAHKERLDDLRTRYAQNQQFIADYERDAAKWEQEAAKEKAKLESPEMIGMGGALHGEVDTGSGADIYGIAQRVREERARAGQVVDVPPGEGISAPDSIAHGRELLNAGRDPEAALKNFEQTKRFSADDLALVRAHGEQLALAARRIEEKFGTTSQEYLIANKALSDWDTRVKPMQTEWHKAGQAQQGYTDIDTGSFTGLERAYREITGKEFDLAQKKKATKLAKEVTDADKAVEAAKPVLQTEIDRIGTKVEPHIRRLADKIIAAMDTAANSALERIKARQAEGRAFSVADPRDLEDVVIYGAAKITKGVVEFGVWSTEMLKEVGEGIKPYLKEIHDRAIAYEDQKTTELAGGGVTAEKVKASKRASKVPTNVADQRKAFQDYTGGPMSNDQLRVLWNRAKTEYIDKGNDSMADTVTKLATDLGLPVKDVLKGLAQTRIVKRVADDVWQKQRQARILKQSAKRWLNTAEETWLQKAVPTAARVMFSLKTGLHGTVAIGTHAPLEVFLHPKIIAENFGKMYKLVFSPEYYDMQVYDLQRRPNYNTANRAKLVNDPTKMEDFNDPKLAQGFPKLAAFFKEKLGPLGRFQGAGVRGYAVLKILRQDLFDNEWNKLPESVKTPELAKMIATSINHMTGVTETKLPDTANYALFAPKLLYSRIQVMVGDPIRAANSLLKGKNMTPEQRWFAMNQVKEKATIFGVATSLLVANQALNNFLGDKKKLNGVPTWLGGGGWNPMESDFMKFRIAGMNVAWGSPFLTMSRLPARLIQIGMGSGGKSKFLVYPDESMYKTIGSYLRTQSSPFIAPIISLVTKADYEDRPLPQIPGYGPPPPVPKRLARKGVKPYTWPEFVTQTVLPIPFQEGAKEVWHYGMANTPQEREALLKALVIVFLMAGTGARIQEDWETGGSPTVNSNKF